MTLVVLFDDLTYETYPVSDEHEAEAIVGSLPEPVWDWYITDE